jgi:UV DNA damage repair endonuclease
MENPQNNNRLVAKLVAQYGFACVLDMLAFSKSLDSSFKKWAENVLFSRAATIVTNSGQSKEPRYHRVSFGARVVNLNILKLLPKKWIHAYHIIFSRTSSVLHPLQTASTIITEAKPLECYSQVCYIFGRQLVTTIEKTSDGRKFYVDHSRHTTDEYRFVVIMKNE